MPFGKRRPEDLLQHPRSRGARAGQPRDGVQLPAMFWMGLGLMLAALGVAMSTLELPAGERAPVEAHAE